MRVFQTITAFLISFSLQINANAQILKKVTDAGNTVNATNNVMATTSGAIANAKSTLGTLLGGKTKEANTFIISGIDYENENLEFLKTDLKNIKGVKDIVTNFKDATVTITIKSKGNATQLWDKIPQSVKSRFKLIQSDERNVMLEYKAGNTVQSNVSTEKETQQNISSAVNANEIQSARVNNPSQTGKSTVTNEDNSSKGSYFVEFSFNDKQVSYASETLSKEACSAFLGPTGKTLAVTFYNAETKTGISFEIADILEKIKAGKYEFDSEKTNKEKATYGNGTNTKQMNVIFQPGDNRRYQIQCSTDPVMNYQGSGYLKLTKFKPVKGGIVEGEFQFSFPVYKTKDSAPEIHQVNSGKFRIAII